MPYLWFSLADTCNWLTPPTALELKSVLGAVETFCLEYLELQSRSRTKHFHFKSGRYDRPIGSLSALQPHFLSRQEWKKRSRALSTNWSRRAASWFSNAKTSKFRKSSKAKKCSHAASSWLSVTKAKLRFWTSRFTTRRWICLARTAPRLSAVR